MSTSLYEALKERNVHKQSSTVSTVVTSQ